MPYYRLAYHKQQTTWVWKSTVLTSLDAVFHFLKIYRNLLPDGIRVFSAPSKEGLNEMLSRENSGLESGSVAGEQFLRDRRLSIPEYEKAEPEPRRVESAARQTRDLTSLTPLHASDPMLSAAMGGGVRLLERRRMEMEWGSGSDHNTEYLFSLPDTIPQFLAWMRLRGMVQGGALHP
ncbi:MAG TPA: hypothetical protein VKR06_42370 [Ktedonosporobacter sp.]|nr:hypothetical protein [Ktedonosporobacter sp.]